MILHLKFIYFKCTKLQPHCHKCVITNVFAINIHLHNDSLNALHRSDSKTIHKRENWAHRLFIWGLAAVEWKSLVPAYTSSSIVSAWSYCCPCGMCQPSRCWCEVLWPLRLWPGVHPWPKVNCFSICRLFFTFLWYTWKQW